MKPEIHPPYYPKARIRCSCGNVIEVGSTRKEMTIEVCSRCHPFYSGKEKLIDVAGRVEKFRTRQEAAKKKTATKKATKKSPAKTGKQATAKKK
jgi:large subunit ribosomal protein L31